MAAQIGYEGYKYATCTSVNEICHGFPSNYVLKISSKVDFLCGFGRGFFQILAGPMQSVGRPDQALMEVTKGNVYKRGVMPGSNRLQHRIGDIGHAIQTYAEAKGYRVVVTLSAMALVSHPREPEYSIMGPRARVCASKEGMTITIDPDYDRYLANEDG